MDIFNLKIKIYKRERDGDTYKTLFEFIPSDITDTIVVLETPPEIDGDVEEYFSELRTNVIKMVIKEIEDKYFHPFILMEVKPCYHYDRELLFIRLLGFTTYYKNIDGQFNYYYYNNNHSGKWFKENINEIVLEKDKDGYRHIVKKFSGIDKQTGLSIYDHYYQNEDDANDIKIIRKMEVI